MTSVVERHEAPKPENPQCDTIFNKSFTFCLVVHYILKNILINKMLKHSALKSCQLKIHLCNCESLFFVVCKHDELLIDVNSYKGQ